ncbi:efflux RND transporter permease subunit [Oryzihumus sp.]|uniref:efflux RND transporter permease subunit n=1 Tax=Oryzihumus sp. TaxID=1968903 RepID=UPI002ED87F3D
MSWVLASGLKMGRLVIAAAVALLVLALVQLPSASVDVYPEFTPPTVQVQSEALGLSAQEVEQLITVPLEQDLLNGVPFLAHLHSLSMPGLSQIDMTFEPGTDLYTARQMVQERMTQAHALPNVGTPPLMIQPLAATSRIAMISLSSKSVSLIDQSILARWKIRPRLMGVPGVANVSIWGQRDRQLQVQVDPRTLNAKGLTLTRLLETAGNALWVSPLTFVEASTPGTGGFIESPSQRLAVQHMLPITAPGDLANIAVEGTSLRLGDVATVAEDHQPLIGDAIVDGGSGLVLVLEKFPEANTEQVTAAVEKAMADMAPGLQGITVDTRLYRPATFIEEATHNLGVTALVSLALLVLVLGLFLWSWRALLVSLLGVLVPVVLAAYVLFLLHTTMTTMTLLGLAVAVGAVVEQTVSSVTGLRARIRARGGPTSGRAGATAAVAEAMAATRAPLVTATLVSLLVITPLLFLSESVVPFTRAAAAAYALALVLSLVVSLTVTPALTVILLGEHEQDPAAGPVAGWCQRTADRVLPRLPERRTVPLASLAVLAVLVLALLPRVDLTPTLPVLHERNLLVQLRTTSGTALGETARVTEREAAVLKTLPGVTDVGTHIGRAITADQAVDVNAAEIWMTLDGTADEQSTIERVRRELAQYPGVRGQVVSYAQQTVDAASRTASDLTVRLSGIDITTMRAKAHELQDMMRGVPGVVGPKVEQQLTQPTVEIEVKLDAARRLGLAPGDVRRDATTLVSGLTVGSIYEEQKIFDVVVLGRTATRASLPGLEALRLDTPSGKQVPLSQVATVRLVSEPTAVEHNGVARTVDVTAGVSGRDPNAVVADLRARIAKLPMPLEYHAEVIGSAVDDQNLNRRELLYALAVLVGAVLLLQAATSSWRRAALLTVTVVVACSGGLVTGLVFGTNGSVGYVAGLLAVLGIASHGLLVQVRRYQELEGDDDHADGTGGGAGAAGGGAGADVVRRGTSERVLPVLLTSCAVAAVFLPPLVLGGAGLELLQPMAVAVLGGLVTYVLTALVVLPALYLITTAGRGPARPDEPHTAGPASAAAAPADGR